MQDGFWPAIYTNLTWILSGIGVPLVVLASNWLFKQNWRRGQKFEYQGIFSKIEIRILEPDGSKAIY